VTRRPLPARNRRRRLSRWWQASRESNPDTFWGAKFGMLTDPYGIRWMFNHTLKKG
jgi:uncharacterized glyoxalase superfamily protein PhnB